MPLQSKNSNLLTTVIVKKISSYTISDYWCVLLMQLQKGF